MTREVIISRSEAKASGLKWYFTGKPCKRGEIAKRKTSNGDCQCTTCLAEYKLRSERWARANPEKHREGASRRNSRWGAKVKERKAEKLREWRRTNPAEATAQVAKRRAVKKMATPPWLTQDDFEAISALYAEAKRLSDETGLPHHVDHIVPLNHPLICGLHVPGNLQVIPANDNLKKSNKWTAA